MSHVNVVSFAIVAASFLVVTLIGFAGARWRPAEDPMQLNEWGLGGRGFGTFISWFLLGGDLYTAYTFIAVPALVYATGAAGFYALSYTIMVFPIVFVFGPRLWSVARARGYVTPGEFVRGRYGSQGLGLAVTLTGILATMPYIALQLVGIESVLAVMGVGTNSRNTFLANLPLVIAFVILAAYTYLAGLRAPALIAFVKDALIYVTVIVAIIYIPGRLGGWGHIFGAASAHLATVNPATGKPYGSLVVLPAGEWAYATLALGSALALFIYPHAVTGVFAARQRDVIRRNAAMLPAYSLVLGLIALLGYMARATPAVNAGVAAGYGNAQLSVPLLFQHMFPSWFAGVGYSAIVIGALVPAAIMSIAAANLFTRNIYKELFRPRATPAQETRVARLASLFMKVGALGFALELNKTFSINLQLLGGIWILQTFPAVVISLYTRWFHRFALIIGWAVGLAYGTHPGVPDPRRRPAALRRVHGSGVRARHLHRHHRGAHQPARLGRVHARLPRPRGDGRVRRDPARRLLRRRGTCRRRACRRRSIRRPSRTHRSGDGHCGPVGAGEALVGRHDLLMIDLEPQVRAAQLAGGHAGRARPAERVEHDDVLAQRPVGLDAPARQLFRKPGEVPQPRELLVAEFPDGADRGRRAERMLLLAGEQVDGLVLAVWPAALSLRHRVALAPDHLAAEKPARVAHRDHEAVGQGEQVPVPQPRLPGVQEGLPPVPGLHVRGVGRVEAGPARAERAVGVVPGTPVHRGVVRVADVEPEQPVRLQLGQQRARRSRRVRRGRRADRPRRRGPRTCAGPSTAGWSPRCRCSRPAGRRSASGSRPR